MRRQRQTTRRRPTTRLVFEQLESRRVLAPVLTSMAFITSPQTFAAGAQSGLIKVELLDQTGHLFTATSNVVVTLTSTSGAGKFKSYPTNSVITSFTVAKGSYYGYFEYTDTIAGMPMITAKDGAISTTQTETVLAGAVHSVLFVTTPPTPLAPLPAQTMIAGAFNPVTIELTDAFGNAVPAPASSYVVTVTTVPHGHTFTVTPGSSTPGENIAVMTDSPTGQFFTSPTSTTPVTRLVVPQGQSLLTFYYEDLTGGVFHVSADGAGLTAGTQTETVTKGASQIVFVPPGSAGSPGVTFTAGMASSVTVQMEDVTGAVATTSAGSTITLTSSHSTGDFSGFTLPPADTVVGSGTNFVTITVPKGTAVSGFSFNFTDTLAGPVTLSATATSGIATLKPGSQQDLVVPGAASTIAFLSGSATSTNVVSQSGAITIEIKDAFGNVITAPAGGQVVSLSTSSGTGTFQASVGGPNLSPAQVTIPAGASTVKFYYTDPTASPTGTPYTLTASAVVGGSTITGTSPMTVFAVPTQIVVSPTSIPSLTAGVLSGPITVTLEDGSGNPAPATHTTTITLATSNSTTGKFFNAAGTTVITSLVIPAGSTTATFQYFDTLASTPTLTVTDTTDGFAAQTVSIGVVAGAPTQVAFVTTSPQSSQIGFPLTITIQLEDKFGNAALATGTGQVISLSDGNKGGVFSPASPITIPAGSSAASFTYTNATAGTYTISLSSSLASPHTLTVTETPPAIVNGSFALPVTTGFTDLSNTTTAGWTWANGDPLSQVGVAVSFAPGPAGQPFFGATPPVGSQAAVFFDNLGGDTIDQNVLLAAGTYTLSWFQIAPPALVSAGIFVNVDGFQQGGFFFTNNAQAWQQMSVTFTVGFSGLHDIQFFGIGPVVGDMVSINGVTIA